MKSEELCYVGEEMEGQNTALDSVNERQAERSEIVKPIMDYR